MSPLKICMVTTFYPPYNFGGDGIFVERLVNALAKDGNEVHVVHDRDAFEFCSKLPATPDPNQTFHPNITVHTIGDGNVDKVDMIARHQLGRPVKRAKQLKSLLESDFDVIHYHNVSLIGGPEVLTYGNAVKLCTLHDHWFVCATHALWRYESEACTKRTCLSCTIASKRPPQFWRYTGAVAEAAKHVNAFISPSQFAKQSHLANGFPADIRVLEHFIPEEHLRLPPAEPPVHPRPFFFFAGRLEKLKGAQFLIEQFRQYKNADLLIAGSGDYEEELRAAASGLNHVHFLGRISSEKLKTMHRQAIAAIVPSLCYETFGLVALEAFSQGTPAIVHNLGALAEVVQAGGGVVYNDGTELIQAMERLRTDQAWRDELAIKAQTNLMANYTEQRHLSLYYAMIAELKGSKSMQEVR